MMNGDDFQTKAKASASKAINQANINATKMKQMEIPVPPLGEQNAFVKKVEALEKLIAEAQQVIDEAPAKKESILKKHL